MVHFLFGFRQADARGLDLSFALKFILLAAAYFLAAYWGLETHSVAGFAAPFWAPTGIAFAALFLWGLAYWPAIFVGAFAANFLAGAAALPALGVALGNSLEAIFAVFILAKYFSFDPRLGRLRDLFNFIFVAALLSPVVSASIGTGVLWAAGSIPSSEVANAWQTWWLGDCLGDLVVAPFLLVWATSGWAEIRALKYTQIMEASLLGALVFSIGLLIFSAWPEGFGFGQASLSYLLYPFLIWSAIRFGRVGSVTVSLTLAVLAIWGLIHGQALFIDYFPLQTALILDSFMAVFSVTGLVIAVAATEAKTDHKRSEDKIKYLDEASRVLGSSLDYEQTFRRIAELAVPHIADWCAIDIVSPGQEEPRSIAIQHVDPEKIKLVDALREKYPTDWNSEHGAPQVLRTGRSLLYSTIPEALIRARCRDDEHYRLIRSLGLRSAMIVPLSSRGRTFGVLSMFSAESGRSYTTQDLNFAEELARRAGVALDNSLLFAEAQIERNRYVLAHQKMEKLAETADSANQIKSLFLANMSHEIRTPLGAILGYADLLDNLMLPLEEREHYMAIIKRNGVQLTQLIDDILDLSKVEAGYLDLEAIPISIAQILADVFSLLEVRAVEKGLRFAFDTEAGLPTTIVTDPMRLRQILINVIGNAIKFTSHGEVRVHVQKQVPTNQKKETPQIAQILFRVSDTGPGVPDEGRDRLFEWFTQADASTTRKYGGTGLGLALSRRLSRALGGDLILENSSPMGSQFLIRIPSERPADEGMHPQAPVRTAEVPLHVKPGLRVLVVEDSPDNRMLITHILQRWGIQVEIAENGREGIEKALAAPYDVILMDLQMPICDGFEATRELRRQNYRGPIVALTAHAMKEEREKTRAAGCDLHLTKPINAQLLIQVIHELSSGPATAIDTRYPFKNQSKNYTDTISP